MEAVAVALGLVGCVIGVTAFVLSDVRYRGLKQALNQQEVIIRRIETTAGFDNGAGSAGGAGRSGFAAQGVP